LSVVFDATREKGMQNKKATIALSDSKGYLFIDILLNSIIGYSRGCAYSAHPLNPYLIIILRFSIA
jgi:hypothetical protein